MPSQQDLPDSHPQETGNTASSFGETSNQESNLVNSRLMSDVLLSTQLSLGTMSSQPNGSQQARSRRGDIHPSGRLERYLASDFSNRNTDTLAPVPELSSVADPVAAPVIWGTTVNIDDSMSMFRDFITNYVADDCIDHTPFYNQMLEYV
jgi:hypothetical protein